MGNQAQFAGYYVALDKGYYSDEGLDVTILPGGPDSSTTSTGRWWRRRDAQLDAISTCSAKRFTGSKHCTTI